MSRIIINISSDPTTMSHFAADLFARITQESNSARGIFLTALSGGSTPQALYRLLAQAPYRDSLPWDKMHFFWGDERCVPQDDKESCYNQAWQAWLSHVPASPKNIHRAKGELSPAQATADYAAQLKAAADDGRDWPLFDLVLLGLGADGHTASLFPGSALTNGVAVVAVTAQYQDRPANRVSMTPDVFNDAHNIAFLATGQEKAKALSKTLTGPRDLQTLPAQRIHPNDGSVWWLVDEAAASLLPEQIEGVIFQRET
jgi:6-phosphogluconolactonase